MNRITDKARLLLQIRQEGVTDSRILAAFESVPRHAFVAETFSEHAYDDTSLPIACGQTISQPSLVAVMTHALDLGDRMKVLEIGTGSGYQTAILASLCRRVYTIERHRPLMVQAENRLRELRLHNVTTRVGDGLLGWPEQEPFDRVVVSAAAPEPPESILAQLSVGAILVLPVGTQGREQSLMRVQRREQGFESELLSKVRFVPLVTGVDVIS